MLVVLMALLAAEPAPPECGDAVRAAAALRDGLLVNALGASLVVVGTLSTDEGARRLDELEAMWGDRWVPAYEIDAVWFAKRVAQLNGEALGWSLAPVPGQWLVLRSRMTGTARLEVLATLPAPLRRRVLGEQALSRPPGPIVDARCWTRRSW